MFFSTTSYQDLLQIALLQPMQCNYLFKNRKRKIREGKFIFIAVMLFDTFNFLCDELALSDEEHQSL